ncbi:MAG: hypothetical protein ABW194_09550 [Novosphingobium sp.]
MSGEAWAYVGLLALALVLPVAALRGSRLPAGTAMKMAAVWVALFVIVALAFSTFLS